MRREFSKGWKREVSVLVLIFFGACGYGVEDGSDGLVRIDGSSTVFPITEAVAEEFNAVNKEVRITIGVSGTGGGFKKFIRGEIDISNASRPIKESELTMANENQVEFIELPVAYDGIAVVVNPSNTWCSRMTTKELKYLWEPEAQGNITHWNQLRSDWPNREIHLFGPGVDSGTYDYFTKAITGREGASRGDITSSEDDNVLVRGVSADELALGFFGYAYYAENQSQLKALAIDDGEDINGAGAIKLSPETVESGTYQPLSRPIFIYIRKQAASRPEVEKFMEFYLKEASQLVSEVGYIPLPKETYELALDRFRRRVVGSIFPDGKGSQVGISLDSLLRED